MSYEASVIADSVAPSGARLTTMAVKFPRFILAEMNTHRDFSRNSASSRAIPISKVITNIRSDELTPEWTLNQAGMQGGELDEPAKVVATEILTRLEEYTIWAVEELSSIGVHKQNANRYLEPFMWHTAVISSTRWENFFSQRCNPAAQPEMLKIAMMMRDALHASKPKALAVGDWHLPFIQADEQGLEPKKLIQIATARCARVSYLGHDGVRAIDKDLELYAKLVKGNHWSPFEHVAQAVEESLPSEFGNFDPGWIQLRKLFNKEYIHGQ